MSKYSRDQLREMAKEFLSSNDVVKKMNLIIHIQMITGLSEVDVVKKIEALAQ